MSNPLTYQRPFLYDKQREMVDAVERYTVVEASTKTGKTVGLIVWLFEEALKGKQGDNCWWVAPVYMQAEIAYRRMKLFISDQRFYTANKTEMSITLANGVKIWFKSGQNVDNLYGEDVIAVVIDEATRCHEDVFTACRSVITATGGKMKIIGNVKGVTNWAYKLARKIEAGEHHNGKYIKITAEDAVRAGVFSREELNDAKDTLPEDVFNELYMCIPIDERGRPFIYGFDTVKNTIDHYTPDDKLPVYLSFDFNVDPMTCSAHQHALDWSWIRTFKEFRLRNSNINEMCEAIVSGLGDGYKWQYVVNGDYSGHARDGLLKEKYTYYKVIQNKLGIANQNMKVMHNPLHKKSRILTNGLFMRHPDCKVVESCTYLTDDLRYVQVNDDGGIDKRGEENKKLGHLLDTIRYYHWSNFNTWIKNYGI